MQKIWEWATEKLTREEIKNEILLSTDLGEEPPCILHQFIAKYI